MMRGVVLGGAPFSVWTDSSELDFRIQREESKHCLIKTWVPVRFINHLTLILPDESVHRY